MSYSHGQGQFVNYRGGGDPQGYGVASPPGVVQPSVQPTPAPQLFQDTSGVPSVPPMDMAQQAQQLFSNPVVTNAAMQYGQGIMSAGQRYIDEQAASRLAGLKRYFAVDTSYVFKKLLLIMFPYTHRDWSLQYSGSDSQLPRHDVNSPDLYIPVMGFVTYVLLTGLVFGTQERFTPEQLGLSASSLLVWLVVEVLLIYLGLFLAQVTAHLSWMDILAYCSYKYTSMILCVGASLVTGVYGYYITLIWTAVAIAYFEVQSLRLRVQPNATHGTTRVRNYLLLVIAVLQPLFVLWLTWSLVMYRPPAHLNTGPNH